MRKKEGKNVRKPKMCERVPAPFSGSCVTPLASGHDCPEYMKVLYKFNASSNVLEKRRGKARAHICGGRGRGREGSSREEGREAMKQLFITVRWCTDTANALPFTKSLSR